jgi:hypothetical protein
LVVVIVIWAIILFFDMGVFAQSNELVISALQEAIANIDK